MLQTGPNAITRKDLYGLSIGCTDIDKEFKFNNIKYQLCGFIGYSWQNNSPEPLHNRDEFTKHPKGDNLSILLGFNKDITENIYGILVNINILAYYTCGPCGYYIEIAGKVGDVPIKAKACLTGTLKRRDIIEIISVDEYLFYIDFSINYFTLAMLRTLV